METHFILSDSQFEQQFESLTIAPALFNHEAHIRLAWIHIHRYGLEQAIENVCTQIKAFATFNGDADRYNHTVTVAAIKAVYHFMLKSVSDNFSSFIKDSSQLKTEFKQLMEAHYSMNIFTSAEAKSEYIKPDLLPFD